MQIQRLRVTYARREAVMYISHLDTMRLWERALRRGNIPLAYSQGFRPKPRIAIGAPLPVGYLSEGELMDLYLSRRLTPYAFMRQMDPVLPAGVQLVGVEEINPRLPSLQSQIRAAEYRVAFCSAVLPGAIGEQLQQLLDATNLPTRVERRDGQTKDYDLRPLIEDLWLYRWHEEHCTVGMRLRIGNGPAGRPEEVIQAMDDSATIQVIERTRLIVAD
ncbi:MAG: TIGR03936 family radical SAM-associated protein [Chloroflexi bacterium]|nr:TIGR03936 family radical SAM-associated protein [Chloroflexota bacterium]MBU1751200.1 TIGR03936 family radical SAM-associated protein [Chloroflexota bacterium]